MPIEYDGKPSKDWRSFEKGTSNIDIQRDFAVLNAPLINNYGHDNFTYSPEKHDA